MLLRIIDGAEDTINIVLESKSKTESYATESYTSPMSENLRKRVTGYFKEFSQAKTGSDSDVIEKLIKYGQNLGDELLGEDHQLIKLKEEIERKGYENLQVQVESDRIAFYKEIWESTILPESKYVLSTVAKSYVRKFITPSLTDLPELFYDLKVTLQSQGKVPQLLNGNTNDNKIRQNKPLCILYIISRPETIRLPFDESNGINLHLNAVAAGGAINYEIHKSMSHEKLLMRLADKENPVHIIHYDGPVLVEQDNIHFVLSDSSKTASKTDSTTDSTIDIASLSKTLVQNKVAVLSVDARDYLQQGQSVSAAESLARIAQSAHDAGFGNVIGLGQITNPWTSQQCFDQVYRKITQGFSLDQAVVEARKALQTNVETFLFSVKPTPFYSSPLLTHYSIQNVLFFSEPVNYQDAPAEGVNEDTTHQKLFGFRSEMLPPLLNQIGDGQALVLIDSLCNAVPNNRVVSICGDAGSGKSQLVHIASIYLAQKNIIDFGFYFDYSTNFYSPKDMLEMIAQVISLDPHQTGLVEEKLMQLQCCFVLDGISDISALESNQSSASLVQFLQTLISRGHMVIVASEAPSVFHELATINIKTKPLSVIEQKILAAHIGRQSTLTEEYENKDWDNLLAVLSGNPWLIKKTIPLLKSLGITELEHQIKQLTRQTSDISTASDLAISENTVSRNKVSTIDYFYEWQWRLLKPVWQGLLILCSDTPGLLLEMLMVAADQKESFAPAKQMLSLLGDDNAVFSEGLDLWETTGFLKRFPHGRFIDSRCASFLDSKRTVCFEGIDQQKLKFYFSQSICEGIRVLVRHMLKQPNQAIVNNLLFNRRIWAEHFENLWFNKDYRGFISVKNSFDQLLQQAKLDTESKAWILDLLERSSAAIASDSSILEPHTEMIVAPDNTIEEKLSWLLLAASVMDLAEAKDSQAILQGALTWRTWFDAVDESLNKQQLPLFQQVATFLEGFYQGHSDWNTCITICQKSYAIYLKHQFWQKVIQSLKSLARYHHKLGEDDQVLVLENKIINDIPYVDSPPGFQVQQMFEILLARLSRAETQAAQILLNQLRDMDEAEKLADMLDGVQCDIHYQAKNYVAALPYYSKVWARALETDQQNQLQQLKPLLVELEQKIGFEYFNEHFERVVPAGTIKPKDYVSNLH